MMKNFAFACLFALAPAAALAADIQGKWLTVEGKGHVVFERCGANICGTIVWIKKPLDARTGKPQLDVLNEDRNLTTRPVLGLRLGEIAPDGDGGWKGWMYNPEDGKSYQTELAINDEGKLVLTGCIMGGLLCDDETWTRVKEPTQAAMR
jgi:uncharacterized protein (DUF2147 family)